VKVRVPPSLIGLQGAATYQREEDRIVCSCRRYCRPLAGLGFQLAFRSSHSAPLESVEEASVKLNSIEGSETHRIKNDPDMGSILLALAGLY
jgi:hypothetical protein